MIAARSKLAIISIGMSLIAMGAGCAGKSMQRVENQTMPQELTKELQDKFEIKEAVSPTPTPSSESLAAESAAVTSKKEKTKKVKKPTAVAEPEIKPGFAWPNRRPSKDPLWIGEKATYEITYFGMAAGDLTLEVLPFKSINNRKVYHIKGHAVSSKVFSFFYELDDTVETFIDYEGLFSHRFQMELDETKQTRATLELNDSEKGRTFYWNRWNHHVKGYTESKDFQPVQPFSQDSLSALFYVRTLPLKDGDIVNFPVISEGKSWEAQVTVVRREEISTPIGKMKTIVLKPENKYQGVLQKKGDSFLWITDDERRFVVRLEAKVRIGTVVANLRKVERGTPP